MPGDEHSPTVHTHDLSDPHTELGPVAGRVRSVLTLLSVLVVVGCVVGLATTWPSDPRSADEGFALERVDATITSLQACDGPDCVRAVAELADGTEVELPVPGDAQVNAVEVGQDVVLGFQEDLPPGHQYSFLESDRQTPITLLIVGFALAVLLLSGWRGVASLLSLGLTMLVLGVYLLPALRSDQPMLVVALTTAGIVMLITMYASHGVSVRSTVALVGTLGGLVLAAVLGSVVSAAAAFTGLDESTNSLTVVLGGVDTRGLLVAGLIIGALGVLDDVTVTQTATVWELAAADPRAPRRSLLAAGMRVGRAHVSATVNTLVLAYVGASLPLLLLVSALGTSWTDAIFSEGIATEIVRGLAGSLGIVAAVPLTTALAAWAVPRPIPSPR
jgi:uncharacterized membrane protein